MLVFRETLLISQTLEETHGNVEAALQTRNLCTLTLCGPYVARVAFDPSHALFFTWLQFTSVIFNPGGIVLFHLVQGFFFSYFVSVLIVRVKS